jgi:hypothetical protein
MPSSVALCRERRAGQGTDTPAMLTFRVGTFSSGTAPAFGRALAPSDGSDLLPLRLPLLLQLGDVVFTPPQFRNVYELCQTRSFPTNLFPLRASRCMKPFGRVDLPGKLFACWCYRSSHNPLGNGISAEIETVSGPDSVRARFLFRGSPLSS